MEKPIHVPCSPWMATGVFPVPAETLLGKNYFYCPPQWPSTNCCFFTASDIWKHGLWSFLPCFCKAVHAVSASLQTCPAPSSQPPEKGRSQPACFSGNMLNKTAAVIYQCCQLQSYAVKPVPCHWRFLYSVGARKGWHSCSRIFLSPLARTHTGTRIWWCSSCWVTSYNNHYFVFCFLSTVFIPFIHFENRE